MEEFKKVWAEIKIIPINLMGIVNSVITTISAQLKTSKGVAYLVVLGILGYDIVVDPQGGKIIKTVIDHCGVFLQTIMKQIKDVNWISLAVIAIIIGLFLNRKGDVK